jgi:alpha-beta hydrolase superfamily lysophospholipase
MTSMAIQEADGPSSTSTDVAFSSLDGTPLRGRYWAHTRPRGLLLISHGLGEHGGSYRRTAEFLVETLKIDVLAFDFRGSGRSPGKRGVVRRYEDLCLDIDAANRWATAERPDLPKFLLGHSNGGLVAIRTVLDRDLSLSGLILSNPSIRVSAHAPAWKLFIAKMLLRIAPQVTMSTGLSNDQLTHDPEVRAEIEADSLRHGWISPPMYFGMLATGRMALDRSAEIRLPALLILGGSDPVIDPKAGRLFFEGLGSEDKTLKLYPGMRHEPLNEIGREAVLSDIATWLDPRLRPRNDAEAHGR